MTLINCENLSFAYSGNYVLKNLSFSVEEGDYLCIVGENGAGKSTLVKGLLKLKKPASGSIVFDKTIKSKEIGYLPQSSPNQKDFPASVYEIVLSGCLNKLGFGIFYTKKQKDLAIENMRKLGIYDLKDSCYRELSGGQKRRVLLARALCAGNKLILLDEPATGLDPLVTRELYQIIKMVNEEFKVSIIMVSHDIKSTLEYANKILHIRGEKTFFGSVKEYKNNELAKEFLGGEI